MKRMRQMSTTGLRRFALPGCVGVVFVLVGLPSYCGTTRRYGLCRPGQGR